MELEWIKWVMDGMIRLAKANNQHAETVNKLADGVLLLIKRVEKLEERQDETSNELADLMLLMTERVKKLEERVKELEERSK